MNDDIREIKNDAWLKGYEAGYKDAVKAVSDELVKSFTEIFTDGQRREEWRRKAEKWQENLERSLMEVEIDE